jgi:hypothetical protein
MVAPTRSGGRKSKQRSLGNLGTSNKKFSFDIFFISEIVAQQKFDTELGD